MHDAFTQLREFAHTQRRRLTDVARDLAGGTLDPASLALRQH